MAGVAVSTAVRIALVLAALVCGIRAAVTDAKTRTLPNTSVAIIAICAFAEIFATLSGVLAPAFILEPPLLRLTWAAGFTLFLLSFEMLWRALHKGAHGLGFGDIKLMGAFSLWLGSMSLIMVLIAALFALFYAFAKHVRTFAFGPHLVAGACVALVLPMIQIAVTW
ncbi:MAG: prepilin peptidase [Coriobacteriales bacterium]|nr:prepilin peptidase [Coriobacteriales bacterium]